MRTDAHRAAGDLVYAEEQEAEVGEKKGLFGGGGHAPEFGQAVARLVGRDAGGHRVVEDGTLHVEQVVERGAPGRVGHAGRERVGRGARVALARADQQLTLTLRRRAQRRLVAAQPGDHELEEVRIREPARRVRLHAA